MTHAYAEVIGDPVSQSKSPAIHRFWLEKLGIDAEYRACHVKPDELDEYFGSRRGDSAWSGCNVTMPHKEAVIARIDSLSPRADRLRAVNTITRDAHGRLTGVNTDVAGVAEPLGRRERCIPAQVQIIGAGGAARAAAFGAIAAGYRDFAVFNRSPDKAAALAGLIGADAAAYSLDQLGPGRGAGSRVVINATSMGMNGADPVPVDLSAYPCDTIVFDMVYAPLDTPLLRQAGALGMRTIDGLEMLVAQAAEAFAMFFGQPAPREHDAELRELLLG